MVVGNMYPEEELEEGVQERVNRIMGEHEKERQTKLWGEIMDTSYHLNKLVKEAVTKERLKVEVAVDTNLYEMSSKYNIPVISIKVFKEFGS